MNKFLNPKKLKKEEIVTILLGRLSQITVVTEFDYGRIEELCFLIRFFIGLPYKDINNE